MTEYVGFDLQRAVRELGDVAHWDQPQGYPLSLALCVMDSIWSLGVRYRAVENVLDRYLKARGLTGLEASESCQDGPGDFLAWYQGVGGPESPERAAEALLNWNRTSSVSGVLKVAAVAKACELLQEMEIESPGDLRSQAVRVEPRWRSEIPGQGSGKSWRYVLMLAGEPGVKPDRMVERFMQRMGADPGLSPDDFVAAIVNELNEPGVTATSVDHRIWTVERNRPRYQFEELEILISDFVAARDWDQFHSIKNLLLALVGEVGELAELVQWKTDSELGEYLDSDAGRGRFAEEIADVMIYLIRLSQKAGVDLSEAVVSKVAVNETKYPVLASRGNAVKYNERGAANEHKS